MNEESAVKLIARMLANTRRGAEGTSDTDARSQALSKRFMSVLKRQLTEAGVSMEDPKRASSFAGKGQSSKLEPSEGQRNERRSERAIDDGNPHVAAVAQVVSEEKPERIAAIQRENVTFDNTRHRAITTEGARIERKVVEDSTQGQSSIEKSTSDTRPASTKALQWRELVRGIARRNSTAAQSDLSVRESANAESPDRTARLGNSKRASQRLGNRPSTNRGGLRVVSHFGASIEGEPANRVESMKSEGTPSLGKSKDGITHSADRFFKRTILSQGSSTERLAAKGVEIPAASNARPLRDHKGLNVENPTRPRATNAGTKAARIRPATRSAINPRSNGSSHSSKAALPMKMMARAEAAQNKPVVIEGSQKTSNNIITKASVGIERRVLTNEGFTQPQERPSISRSNSYLPEKSNATRRWLPSKAHRFWGRSESHHPSFRALGHPRRGDGETSGLRSSGRIPSLSRELRAEFEMVRQEPKGQVPMTEFVHHSRVAAKGAQSSKAVLIERANVDIATASKKETKSAASSIKANRAKLGISDRRLAFDPARTLRTKAIMAQAKSSANRLQPEHSREAAAEKRTILGSAARTESKAGIVDLDAARVKQMRRAGEKSELRLSRPTERTLLDRHGIGEVNDRSDKGSVKQPSSGANERNTKSSPRSNARTSMNETGPAPRAELNARAEVSKAISKATGTDDARAPRVVEKALRSQGTHSTDNWKGFAESSNRPDRREGMPELSSAGRGRPTERTAGDPFTRPGKAETPSIMARSFTETVRKPILRAKSNAQENTASASAKAEELTSVSRASSSSNSKSTVTHKPEGKKAALNRNTASQSPQSETHKTAPEVKSHPESALKADRAVRSGENGEDSASIRTSDVALGEEKAQIRANG
ncbi:MAG: hypothetical protein JW941_09000, partial [Candidatus Coatesbacteria bacterium]|nr:hypothetical protein [Candidatus Coatesbacteria bacterium]